MFVFIHLTLRTWADRISTSIDLMKVNGITLKARWHYPTETITRYWWSWSYCKYTCSCRISAVHLGVDSKIKQSLCFMPDGTISFLYGKLLKLIHQFIYLGSNISFTESVVNICISIARIALDRLSTLWKSNISDKIKWEFFQSVTVSVLLYGCTTWLQKKCLERKRNILCTMFSLE